MAAPRHRGFKRRPVAAALFAVGACVMAGVVVAPTALRAEALAVSAAPPDVPDSWQRVVDDTDMMSVPVPPEWIDQVTAPQTDDEGATTPRILASTDADSFQSSPDAPGILMLAIPYDADTDAVLAANRLHDACTDESVADFDDGGFHGQVRRQRACGDTTTEVYTAVAAPESRAVTVVVHVQILSPQDRVVVDIILAWFNLRAQQLPSGDAPVEIHDDTGALIALVPAAWNDVITVPGGGDPVSQSPYISASTDSSRFLSPRDPGFEVPGMLYRGEPYTEDPRALIEQIDPVGCGDGTITPYNDGLFSGWRRTFPECGTTGVRQIYVVASPRDHSFTAIVAVRVTTPDDPSLRAVLDEFTYDPNVTTQLWPRR